MSTDAEHRFELALQLADLDLAHQLAKEAQSEHKWKQLADLATKHCRYQLAQVRRRRLFVGADDEAKERAGPFSFYLVLMDLARS